MNRYLCLLLALAAGCGSDAMGTDAGPRTDAPATDGPAPDAPMLESDCPTLDGSNPRHITIGRASSGPAVLEADTTWTSENVYFVIGSLDVQGATLTIEAGTQVCLDGGMLGPPSLDFRAPTVGGGPSRLVVSGTADEPVVFAPATSDSRWNQINLNTESSASIANLVLVGGGSGGTGVLRVPADFAEPFDATVTIRGTSGMAMSIRSDRGLAASSRITVESLVATAVPSPVIEASLLSAATLSPTNFVVGAGVPDPLRWIRVSDNEVDTSLTLRGDLDLPYRITGDLSIARGSSTDPIPTLTLMAGVELLFESGRLRVGSSSGLESDGGNLVAEGTAANPVRLASRTASPAAGDWVGVEIFPFSFEPSVTVLRHVVIADAGQDLGGGVLYCGLAATPLQAAIRLPYSGAIATFEGPRLENIVIEDSAGDGLAFTCLPTRCLSTDYSGAVTGTGIAGVLLRPRGCP